jgi:Ca2+-binding EF-hand superfamily protein
MGNIVGLGYTPNDSNCPEEVTYVDRLSTYDLKRYKEGFRRICRSENVSSHQNDTTSITTTTAAASQTSFGSKNVADATKASNMCLNKQTFRQKILSAFTMIPSSLSDRLFDVLDVKKTEKLTIENVISGIAWLKHGTKEEKEKLLYIIYDLDGNGELTRDVLEMFMDAIYGRKRGRSSSTIEFLNQIFKEVR